jgi:hypothetical protein
MGLSGRSFEVVDLVTNMPRNEGVIMHENEEIVYNHGPTRIPVLSDTLRRKDSRSEQVWV